MDEITIKPNTKVEAKRPPLHKVILINDDYTPREFVVTVLKTEFHISEDQAVRVMTTAHRRAVDRVRAEVAASGREQKTAWADSGPRDEVADVVEASLDRERVQRCVGQLTEVQRQSITLAYYSGYTYRQVSALVGVTLAAVKSRIRDGLLRMRDCLGVS